MPATLETPTRAFVSSTFVDLSDHRKVAIESLRKAGLMVDPMELWPADGREPKRASLDRVRQCDIFVLLVGRRRGHVPDGDKESVTQQEYREALRLSKPVLVFMLSDEAPWYSHWDERKTDPLLEAWIKELREIHTFESFSLQPSSIDVLPAVHRLVPRLTHMSRDEREYKFGAPSNTQFKFTTIQQPNWVIQRLIKICSACGIDCLPPRRRNIRDQYYDDERLSLADAGLLIRKRIDGEQRIVTCKSVEKTVDQALHRREVEIPCDAALEASLDSGKLPELLVSTFWSEMKTHLGNVGIPFRASLTVHNERTEIPLRTGEGQYTFCYDRYFYEAGADYSEYFSEIEIEVEADTGRRDEQLRKLIDALCLLTDYAPLATSKYHRGVQWLRLRNDAAALWILVCEIIGLEERGASDQKQVLQTLCHYIKTELVAINYDVSTMLQSPYPNGFLLLFEDLPSLMLEVLHRTAEGIRNTYVPLHSEYSFEFRAVLEQSSGLRYTGISESVVIGTPQLAAISELLKTTAASRLALGKTAALVLGVSELSVNL